MNEQWIRWEPITGSEGKYYVYKVYNKINELEIVVIHEKNKEKKLRLLFEDKICSYSDTNETLTLQILSNVKEKHGPNFYGDWNFFIVENSEYIKRLSIQSRGSIDAYHPKHFVLMNSDSITDVISCSAPKASWITDELPEPNEDEADE